MPSTLIVSVSLALHPPFVPMEACTLDQFTIDQARFAGDLSEERPPPTDRAEQSTSATKKTTLAISAAANAMPPDSDQRNDE
jgi:hypothetical protein